MSALARPELKAGEYLKMARERCGFTQQAIADLMEVSQSDVSRWELGRKEPSVFEWARLAKILDQEWMLDLHLLPSGCSHVLAGQPA